MKHRARQIAAIGAFAALASSHQAGAQTVDDLFLIQTSVQPNVLLLMDNSYRMNEIEWHPAFDPDVASTCAAFSNTTVYQAGVGLIDSNNETYCGNTRKIFTDSETTVTLYDGRYLNWYFSDDADPYYNDIQNAKASQIGCNSAGGGRKFEELYRRTRNTAARHVLLDVLCLAEPKGIRFGLGSLRTPADAGGVDPNGGYVAIAVDRNQPSHASNMEAHVKIIKSDNWAPVSEAIFQFYTYLMSRNAANLPFGADGVTQFPRYTYDRHGNYDTGAGMMSDPVQYACQKQFIILVTGGLGSRDDFDQDPASTAQGFANFGALIGNYYADAETEDPGAANEETFYLDDIAKFMHERDSRPDFDGDQTVDLYTIGFGTTSDYDEYLERTAELGGGLFYHANEGEGLSRALVAALNDIVEKARSFTAATVPSSRTADGSDFYNSFFIPSGDHAFWEGHLRSWKFSAAGEILDRDGHCALDDPDGGTQCNNGPFKKICQTGEMWPACVRYYWDAGDATNAALVPGDTNPTATAWPSPARTTPHTPPTGWPTAGNNNRQLFTSKLNGGSPSLPVLTDLDQNLTAADMKISTFAPPPDQAPNSIRYSLQLSMATNAEGLADEVVAYARGCHFGTGALADVSTVIPCDARPWLIGDIFHSDPIVVRGPLDRELGTAYEDFRANYFDRDRIIYTGTNGGFLEGFHAGDWDTTIDDAYNQGSGVELFGFMPWQPRTRIKHQIVDAPADRTHYVDGGPQVADAWLYNTWTDTAQTAAQWRTVMVGGLREGGRHYYALDITNPSGDPPPGGGSPIAYPAIQWEFPNESDFNSGTGDYLSMGQTWGQPVITRVKLNASGTTVERWVGIVTAGYDATSDPNPVEVDPSAGRYVSSNCATTANTSTSRLAPAAQENPTIFATAPSCQGRAIYMLDLKTGKVIAQQKMGFDPDATGSASAPSQMLYSIVSTPAVLDLDADGFADVIYVGDLRGQIWKWVINAVGKDCVNDSCPGTGGRAQLNAAGTGPTWPFQLFFQAPSRTISGVTYYKNIFQPPAAAMIDNQLWITFGTGERAAIGFPGVAGDEDNRYYVINDPSPLSTGANVVTELPSSGTCAAGTTCVPDITSSGTPGTRGYFFKATNAEKFVTTSVIFAGQVITASFTPSDPSVAGADKCQQRGSGKLYVFDLKTGVGEYTDGSGNPQRWTSLGVGLPTDPKISIGVGGEDNKIVIQRSGTEIEILDAENVDFGRGIIYWREIH